MKSLIVIDDKSIRRKAFRDAELIIRKIDRLEAGFDDFHRIDQKLFTDWYALTFREHENRIRSLRDQYRELAQFHNEMVTIARMHDVSMPEAYRILRDEQDLFETGSEKQKAARNFFAMNSKRSKGSRQPNMKRRDVAPAAMVDPRPRKKRSPRFALTPMKS
jgi:hypothetical protein